MGSFVGSPAPCISPKQDLTVFDILMSAFQGLRDIISFDCEEVLGQKLSPDAFCVPGAIRTEFYKRQVEDEIRKIDRRKTCGDKLFFFFLRKVTRKQAPSPSLRVLIYFYETMAEGWQGKRVSCL